MESLFVKNERDDDPAKDFASRLPMNAVKSEKKDEREAGLLGSDEGNSAGTPVQHEERQSSSARTPENVVEQISQRFNAEDADAIFRSSDRVLFKVYKRFTLDSAMAEGFEAFDRSAAVITLGEPASVLELLFQYLYPQPQPKLKQIPFRHIAPLAEAVEKYRVFPAMEVCRERMLDEASQHPVHVLSYAMKYDLDDVADVAALHSLDVPLTEAAILLDDAHLIRWIKYRERWLQAMHRCLVSYAANAHPDTIHHSDTCMAWAAIKGHVLHRLHQRVSAIRDADELFRGLPNDAANRCLEHTSSRPKKPRCGVGLDRWKAKIQMEVNAIALFTAPDRVPFGGFGGFGGWGQGSYNSTA